MRNIRRNGNEFRNSYDDVVLSAVRIRLWRTGRCDMVQKRNALIFARASLEVLYKNAAPEHSTQELLDIARDAIEAVLDMFEEDLDDEESKGL